MKPVFQCKDLSLRYKGAAADTLVSISLTLQPGERTALLGVNGSGKTTLLSLMAGLLPFQGSATLCNLSLISANFKQIRGKIGFLFSNADTQILFPRVLDDVSFTLQQQGVTPATARERASAMLHELGMGEYLDAAPHQLSHGQRQRVALAGVLVTNPALLLLDEPTAQLDYLGKEELAAILTSLSDTTILLATHDLAFAAKVCQRFILLEQGTIIRDTPDIRELNYPPA